MDVHAAAAANQQQFIARVAAVLWSSLFTSMESLIPLV